VTSRVEALLLANLLVLAVGCGLLPILRLARTRWEIVVRLPLAYAVGLAATGIAAAELTLVGVPFGRLALALLAVAALALGLTGLPGGEPISLRRPRGAEIPALVLLALAAAIAVPAARLAAVRPFREAVEWQIWATRAKALWLFGHPASPVFSNSAYPGLRQPLLLPALQALTLHFRGSFDDSLLHLQLFLFAVAFAGGSWTLLRRVSSPVVLAASLLAIFAAPAFLDGLVVNTGSIPLAVFAALGAAGLAGWLRTGEGGHVAAGALFLAAATLTGSEGECLAAAALVAAAAAAERAPLRPLAVAAAFVVAIDLTWRGWLEAENIGGQSAHPGASALWDKLWSTGSWSLLAVLVLVGLLGALVLRQYRRALYVAVWLVASFAFLLVLGTSPSPASSATVAGLLVGGTLLVPFLLHAGPVLALASAPSRTLDLPASAGTWLRRTWRLPRRTAEALEPSPTQGAFPWRRPRREVLLLALVAAATLTPVFGISAQDVSRVCLSRAILHFRLNDDSCFNAPFGRDKSVYNGHTYSDKAPGMSLLDLPAVAAARIPSPYHWPFESVRLWVSRVLVSGLALILCAFLVGRISEGLTPGYGGISLVTFALGTLVAPLGAANFEHGTAGMLGLATFALAWRRRPLAAGLVAGAALLVAYEAAMIVAIVSVYALLTRGRRFAAGFAAGAVPGIALLGLYNRLAFGAPWHFSYAYKSQEFAAQQSSGFFGIHLPYLHAIREVFVGRGGLLVISPVVVAALAGLVLLARRYRPEALVCFAVVVAFVILEAGYFDPYGGLSPGPRFFVPALPFLALGLGPAFARSFKLTTLLAAASVLPMTAVTLTWSYGAPDPESIWHDLQLYTSQWGSSFLVQALSSSVLEPLGASRGEAATFVAVAAVAAFLLALPVTLRRTARAEARAS
jgi:hypothetical protein